MTPLEDLLQQCTVKIMIPGGWGTGFFVAPGLMLTCAHVVRKAVDFQVTVFYPAQQKHLSATVQAKADDGKTLDMALIELVEPLSDHPCVLLDEEPVAIGQALYSYGYLESYTNAAPVRPINEGLTGDTPPLLKLQGAQIEKGISGAALLNLKTGKICGMVKETRAASFDLGGGAIPTRVILEQFPQLRDLQREFHGDNRRWSSLISKSSEIDFQPYLQSVTTTYAKWWQLYTLTDAAGKLRQEKDPAPMFDFGLMVQTVVKEMQEQENAEEAQEKKEKIERFSVLKGIRKYADQHVLLVGRPGSGKSTALARLLLEEATTQNSEAHQTSEVFKTSEVSAHSPRIPVLVELRYWQGALSDLIHNAIARHDPTLKAVSLDGLLTNALLLFDGVNELPSEEARSQLIAFRRNHPKLPMIFTTRDLSLGGDLGIEQKLEMQPLTEPQMQAFIRAYVPGQAEAMLQQLKARLREFGQTPLLLWMLCEVFQQAPNNQLPSNLGGVFQAFTQMYEKSSVRKHEVALLKGDVRPLSDRRLWKKALMAIAAIMMQGKTPVDFRVAIHRDEAERELSRIFPNEKFPVRDILDDLLKYHLLQNRSADQIEFRHQLIQEYYAAEYLLKLLPTLTDDQLKRDYLNHLKWTEPLALMLALVDEEAQALRVVKLAMDKVDLMLGARLAGEIKTAFQTITVSWIDALEIPLVLKCQCWATSQSERAIPGLLQTLEDQDSVVRWSAAEALGKIGSEQAIPGLLMALADQRSARWSAAEALGKIGSDRAISGLLQALEHQESYVRIVAVKALGKIGSDQAISGLLQALNHQHSYTRTQAARALGEIGSDQALSGLLQAVEDPDSSVRTSAVAALGKIGSDQTLAGLSRQFLEHPNFSIARRGVAVAALGEIGTDQAVAVLLRVLEDREYSVRRDAVHALGTIGTDQAVAILLRVLEDQHPHVHGSAANALGKIGSDQAISGLLQALKHQHSYVHRSAANALGKIGSDQAISGLLQTLEDPDSSVREDAANALGEIGSDQAISGLLHALEDREYSVRKSAARALGKIGNEKAVPALLQSLKDQHYSVRGDASEALEKIGSDQAISDLLQTLEDQYSYVRRKAASALGKIGDSKLLAELWKQQFISISLDTDSYASSETEIYPAIFSIQNHCQFYNYEIFQAHLAAQKADRPTNLTSDRPSTTNSVIYDLRGAAIANFAHEVHGNQIVQPEKPQ